MLGWFSGNQDDFKMLNYETQLDMRYKVDDNVFPLIWDAYKSLDEIWEGVPGQTPIYAPGKEHSTASKADRFDYMTDFGVDWSKIPANAKKVNLFLVPHSHMWLSNTYSWAAAYKLFGMSVFQNVH